MPKALTFTSSRAGNASRRGVVAWLLVAGGMSLVGPALVGVPASATGFLNSAPIVLSRPGPPPGCPDRCPSERAAPYPSGIPVNGQSGTVTDVNVILVDLTYEHNGPADADVVLVAPGGRAVMLMSDACGDNDSHNPITKAITVSFDDQAAASLPEDGACKAGNFRPVDDDNDGEFPFHQPDEFPEGPAAPAGTLPLSTFNGIDPNGTWSLYVVDDSPNDPDPSAPAGQIGGGWVIDISTSPGHLPPPTVPEATAPAPAGGATTAGRSSGNRRSDGTSGTQGGNTAGGSGATNTGPAGPEAGAGAGGAPGSTTTTEPGSFQPLAADTEDDSGDTLLWAVGGLLVAVAIGLVAMSRAAGRRRSRR